MKQVITTFILAAMTGISGCQTMDNLSATASTVGATLGNMVKGETQTQFDGKFIDDRVIKEQEMLAGMKPKAMKDYQLKQAERENHPGARKVHLAKDKDLERYLQNIADKLVAGWPGQQKTITVKLSGSLSYPPQVEKNGTILIPLGAIKNSDSEDELAFLIGHEISHIFLDHFQRVESVKATKELVNDARDLGVAAYAIEDFHMVDNPGSDYKKLTYSPTQKNITNQAKVRFYSGVLKSTTELIFDTSWQRGQEDEADLLGADLAEKAGYSLRATKEVLERLHNYTEKNKLANDRMAKGIQATLESALTLDADKMGEAVTQVGSELADGLISTVSDSLTSSYHDALEREEMLTEYVDREHKAALARRITKKQRQKIKAIKAKKGFVNTIEGLELLHEAQARLAIDEIDTARTLLKSASKKLDRSFAPLNKVWFDYYQARGQHRLAKRELSRVDWSMASYEFRVDAIKFFTRQNEFNDVLNLSADLIEHPDYAKTVYVDNVIATYNSGEQELAKQKLNDCSDVMGSFASECVSLVNALNGKKANMPTMAAKKPSTGISFSDLFNGLKNKN